MPSKFNALREIQERGGQNAAAVKKQAGLNLKLQLKQMSSASAAVQQSFS